MNNGRTARYSEKDIIAGRYIPFKAGESVAVCFLTKLESQARVQGNTKDRHMTFVRRHYSNSRKTRDSFRVF